ncbi:MAG: PIN domain-containing protein [Candidatus Anammoxibacter sp.]
MNKYVLDTSALLAYIENEEGVEEVESLFNKAFEGEADLFISTISCIEVFYISLKEQGEKIAIERLELINNLMLKQEVLNEQFIEIVGKIKATLNMSFADSCIAGLAKIKEATLVHKDPEYDQLKNEINQLKLPYKVKD